MNIQEARIGGRPALINVQSHEHALLPEHYKLVRDDNGIVGAIDLDTLNEASFAWVKTMPNQTIIQIDVPASQPRHGSF